MFTLRKLLTLNLLDVNILVKINVKIKMNPDLSQAIQYHYGKFPPKNLDYQRFVPELIAATDAVARYDQMLKGMHNNEILLAPMRNQEAVISSRMEGTISTMDEILKYEADYPSEDEENIYARSDVIETILYKRALRNAQRAMQSGQGISLSMIKTLHEQLLWLGRGASKSPGKLKTEQNYLADKKRKQIMFVPINPIQLQDGLDRLFEHMTDGSYPALIRTALTHVEFEALHPFEDGNGRIGRMIITLMMWSSGIISAPHFYISSFFEDHKDEYIDTMRHVSEANDWESWCKFFLLAVQQQAFRNLEIAESIHDLYEEMKHRFSALLASKWSALALDFIFTNPVFRNNRFTNNAGIPPATAARFTRLLIDNGFLVTIEEASGRRPAMYSFEPLMKLVRV